MAGVTRRNINECSLGRRPAQLRRSTPAEAAAAMADGWTLVDTRSEDVRRIPVDFVFRAYLTLSSPAPQVIDPVEIDDVQWFALDALPRPLSNRTVLRIEDALSDRPAGFRIVPPDLAALVPPRQHRDHAHRRYISREACCTASSIFP